MLIYRKDSGKIIAKIPKDQPYNYLGEDVLSFHLDSKINDWKDFMIVERELVEMTPLEKEEMRLYSRVLSEEERYKKNMLEKLTPTREEIQKAENTIEILELLSEVL